MTEPVPLAAERRAMEQAIVELELGRKHRAIALLLRALSRRAPPPTGQADPRSRLRADIKQAIAELEDPRANVSDAIHTLRRGLESC